MATMNVMEFARQGLGLGRGDTQAPELPAVAAPMAIGLSASPAESSPFNAKTRLISLVSDVDARIAFGTAGFAGVTASSWYVAAGVPYFFALGEMQAKAGSYVLSARTA